MENIYQDILGLKRDFGGCGGRPKDEKWEKKFKITFLWNLEIWYTQIYGWYTWSMGPIYGM